MKLLKAIKGAIRLKLAAMQSSPVKLVVGASGVFEPGWVPTDIHTLNLLKPHTWKFYFKKRPVDVILAEHVWEHLSLENGKTAAQTCYTFLRKGGYVRVAVPDGFHPDEKYIDYVKPGGHGAGADDHKVLYNYKLFREVFEQAGFTVELLEYFDEHGRFHFKEWNKEQGMIHRSKRYDERNADGQLNYTSLILDAKK